MKNGMIEYADGTRQWYYNDQLHRVDGPAVEYAIGTRFWYLNGQLHRVDGPAIEYADGTRKWYSNGQLHRVDGPAIEYEGGTREWYLNGVIQPEPKDGQRLNVACIKDAKDGLDKTWNMLHTSLYDYDSDSIMYAYIHTAMECVANASRSLIPISVRLESKEAK